MKKACSFFLVILFGLSVILAQRAFGFSGTKTNAALAKPDKVYNAVPAKKSGKSGITGTGVKKNNSYIKGTEIHHKH